MPGIGIHQSQSKQQLKSNIKKPEEDQYQGDGQVPKKKKARRKVQFRLDSGITDLTKDAVVQPEQVHFRYENEEYYDEESDFEEQVVNDYDHLKIRKENFSQQFIPLEGSLQQSDELKLSARDSQTQAPYVQINDINQTPQPMVIHARGFSEDVSQHNSYSNQTEQFKDNQDQITSEQLLSQDSSALNQINLGNDITLDRQYATLINSQNIGKKINTQKVSLSKNDYIQKEIRVDESNINLSSLQELNPSNMQYTSRAENAEDVMMQNYNDSNPASLTNLAIQKVTIHEEVDIVDTENSQPKVPLIRRDTDSNFVLDKQISGTDLVVMNYPRSDMINSSPDSISKSPDMISPNHVEQELNDSKDQDQDGIESPGKPTIQMSKSFKSKQREMQQLLGDGSKGLNRLNEVLDQKKAQTNQFKRLFSYIETIENYKREMGIDNIQKLMINYPDPQILEIFTTLFKSFQDMTDSCKKRAFMELHTQKYKLCERILTIPAGTPKSMNQLTPDEETGMYMICNGEVVVLKNEKNYKKFLQTEDKIAAERKEASQISETVQFGAVAKIGWVITQYMLRTPKFLQIIDKKRDVYHKKGLMKSFVHDKSVLLSRGEVFGDFSLIKHRVFNPIYAIAMHPETQVLYLNKQKLRDILDVDPENFKIIKDKIPAISSNSTVIQKKICRSFEDCEFFPGQVIIKEGDAPQFMYLIKEGTCGIYNEIQVNKIQKKADKEVDVKPPFPTEEFEQLQQLQKANDSLSPRSPALSKGPVSPPKDEAKKAPPNKKKVTKKEVEEKPEEELFTTQNVKVCEVSKYEWIGDEFILTDKNPLNRQLNIEAGKHTQTVIARTYVKAMKVSCLDIRKKIPKEYQKELKALATSKIEFLAERIENVRKGILQLKKLDEESRPYEQKTEGIKQIHPHIPQKMVSSIGFGDGKIRNRHHFRCADSIRIGEIALNEDLIVIDETLPLSERIIQFGPEKIQKGEQFQVSIDRHNQRVNHHDTEGEILKSEEVSYVQREIENLQHQKWLKQLNLEKKKRPTKKQSNDYDADQWEAANVSNMINTTSRLGAGSKSNSQSPGLDFRTSMISSKANELALTSRVNKSPKTTQRFVNSPKKTRNQTVHGSLNHSLELSKGSYEGNSTRRERGNDVLYPVAKMRDKKKPSMNTRNTSLNVSQIKDAPDDVTKLNVSQDSYNDFDTYLQINRSKNKNQNRLSKQQILDKISEAQRRSQQKNLSTQINQIDIDYIDGSNQKDTRQQSPQKIVQKKVSAAIATSKNNIIIERAMKDNSALTGATVSVNQSGRGFTDEMDSQMRIIDNPQPSVANQPGMNIQQTSSTDSKHQSSLTANIMDSDYAQSNPQSLMQSSLANPIQEQNSKKMYIQDQNIRIYQSIKEEQLQNDQDYTQEHTGDGQSQLADEQVIIEQPSGYSTLNDYNPDDQNVDNIEELRKLRRRQNDIMQRKQQFQLGLALDSIQPDKQVDLIQTNREVVLRGPDSSFLDSYDVNLNARNSMALPKTENVQPLIEEGPPEMLALEPMIQKYQAINMFKSNKELEGIQRFLDRDHNQSDMTLAKKNRQRYQEYLKNFKGRCIPSKQVFEQSLVRLEEQDPEQYHRIMKLKTFKEMTLVHMEKEQIQARKMYKMIQHTKGYDEDFQPQQNNKILTSRFGKLIQQSQEFADGLDDISLIRGGKKPKKRAVSLSRAFDVGHGRNLSVGRSGSMFPSRKLNIVDPSPMSDHQSEQAFYESISSKNFLRDSNVRPTAKYQIQADLSVMKQKGNSQVYNHRYGSNQDQGFGLKDKDVVSLRESTNDPTPWKEAKQTNRQSPLNSDYQKSFATSLNAHAIMTMIMSGYKVPGLQSTALGDPTFLEQLEQPDVQQKGKGKNLVGKTGPDTALNQHTQPASVLYTTQGPTPQNIMTHKFGKDSSFDNNKSEKSLLRFHFRDTMKPERKESNILQKGRNKNGFTSVPPPKSGMHHERNRSSMQIPRMESILPQIYNQAHRDSSMANRNSSQFQVVEQPREYGKFTEKLKLARQRKEELFMQKMKRKLKVEKA